MTSYDLHETSMKYHAMETAVAPFSSSSPRARQNAVDQVARMLHAGKVYRREDLARVSKAVDRHMGELVAVGALKRLAQGLYYAPKRSVFGVLPPDDHELVAAFLRDEDFLVFSPSMYNTLGLGTSQLYNKTLVYNHKRHGRFTFGNRQFDFRVKPRFPRRLTPEFLFVDALNNLDELAEDKHQVLQMAERKLSTFDPTELRRAVLDYASVATQKRFKRWLNV
ncbi:hypothetical protein EV700_1528 [Fluviicoccus keumensis]|uniref:Transcriptional regulator, AbiEi antitoxin, Type IV TA system n=1 Tax=Fluviicoccus keumensis TaxID=1435465 RepID=A0A4V2G635_9GAMM|nr:hypothetical protein [Fluviicoccus keumensis]RZU47136.1 hypothetical protein EV700_1528 [Fluviicoccus keumensis]